MFRHSVAGDLILPNTSLVVRNKAAAASSSPCDKDAGDEALMEEVRVLGDMLFRPPGDPQQTKSPASTCWQRLPLGVVFTAFLTALGLWLLVEYHYLEGLTGIQVRLSPYKYIPPPLP